MAEEISIPSRSLIEGVERTLIEVVPHAMSGERICLFKSDDGTQRFVSSDEWLAGVRLLRERLLEQGVVTADSSGEAKVALFRSLFRGREGIHAHGFRRTDGKIAYSPACARERTQGCPRYTKKAPGLRCGQCNVSEFLPLTGKMIGSHMRDADESFKNVLGLYVMTSDSKTWVLVADFDKDGWKRECRLYCEACKTHGLTPAVERSRSGNGAHVWLFFEEAIDASLARDLGSTLITWAMTHAQGMSFSAFDRLFPTQDTLTEDGLGNLIALPFQGLVREQGNSVFVDEDFSAYPDQWRFLSSVAKMGEKRAREIVEEAKGSPLGAFSSDDDREEDTREGGAGHRRSTPRQITSSDLPQVVEIVKSNMLCVRKEGLSCAAQDRIRRLAVYHNSDFYIAQTARLPVRTQTKVIPRLINCGDEDDTYIMIPRGCESRLLALIEEAGARYKVTDERRRGEPIQVTFKGSLRPGQREAAEGLLSHEDGVLSAPTSFGKTVIGAWLIASLKMRTLVLVNKVELADQWMDTFRSFLDIEDPRPPLLTKSGRPSKRKRSVVGRIGAGKNNPSGIVDIATYQSLVGKDDVGMPVAKSLVGDYDLVIVDECHHVAADNYALVVRSVRARRVYGMSATPKRDDGLWRSVFMLLGPIRQVVEQQKDLRRLLVPRFTKARFPEIEPGSTTNQLRDIVCGHPVRNRLIVSDVTCALSQGRTPIVLTRTREHVSMLAALLEEQGVTVVVFVGGTSAKARRERRERILELGDRPFCVVATGAYVGEGFDLPRLDTLVLACPYSWENVVTQFVGRIHREHEGKSSAIVYDYVDGTVPQLDRMYKRRLKTYRKLGYEVEAGPEVEGQGASIVDGESCHAMLERDVSSATRSVDILAPYAGKSVVEGLLPSFGDAVARGVSVRIVVNEPVGSDAAERLSVVADRLRDAGCEVTVRRLEICGIALMDGKVSWYGSLPLLAKPKEGDCDLRIVGAEVASDIATMLATDG